MVVFTCNNCGDSLQKPKVEKHYQTTCRRNAISVSCMDCFKDFRGGEYVEHIKCISEAERYSGKNYTPKAGQNKGEKKQLAWCDMVKSVMENNNNITPKQRFVLNYLQQNSNIPRNKLKFMRFMANSYHSQKDTDTIESVWNILEAAQKQQMAPETKPTSDNSVKENKKPEQNGNHKSTISEESSIDNYVKENKQSEQNGNQTTPEASNSDAVLSKKERKEKRKREKYEAELTEVKNSASENASDLIDNDNEDTKKKRKIQSKCESIENEKTDISEEAVNEDVSIKISGSEDKTTKEKFNWFKVIIDVLESKNNELSIKKLRKKVLTEYKSFNEIEECSEKVIAKFNKKINKIKGVKLEEDKAILVKE